MFETTPEKPQNHFENLPVAEISDDDDDDDAETHSTSASCSECLADMRPICPGLTGDSGLADDELGNAIEFATILQV